jgi:hypothetical protein
MPYIYFEAFGRTGAGAVKRQKLFPSEQLTTQIERNDAKTHRLWSRRGLNPKKKTGRGVSDRILLDYWIGRKSDPKRR